MSHGHNHFQLPHEPSGLMKLATYAAVGMAAFLVLLKFWAWQVSASTAILSSMVDSLMDLVVSGVNMLAVRYALQPPDEDHHFGHNSAEDVAALGQGAFIAGSAIFIAITAIEKLLHPAPLEATGLGITVMAVSLVMTLALVSFQHYVIKRSQSIAVKADSLHYASDILMNGAVIVALVLSAKYSWYWADPVFALAVIGVLLWGAWHIGKTAFDRLMDKSFPAEEVEKIRQFALNTPGVLGVHRVKTRYSGIKSFIQMDLELDGSQTLYEAHKIADGLEKQLADMYPGGDIIIHEDPKM